MQVEDDAVIAQPETGNSFRLNPVILPTVERPAFHHALALAKVMGSRPSPALVRSWATAMKSALK